MKVAMPGRAERQITRHGFCTRRLLCLFRRHRSSVVEQLFRKQLVGSSSLPGGSIPSLLSDTPAILPAAATEHYASGQ